MIDVDAFQPLKSSFLASCCLDPQGLFALLEDIREELNIHDERLVRDIASSLLSALLRDGLIEAGFPSGPNVAGDLSPVPELERERVFQEAAATKPRAWVFDAWKGDPDVILHRIQSAWSALGREPDWNEVCWFRATDAGRQHAGFARIPGSGPKDGSPGSGLKDKG